MPFQGRESDLGLHCFFVQPFRFLFCAKGFNPPPAHSNRSQAARANCSGVTQPTGQCSSRGLFLNRALLHCSFQAVLHCVKAEFGFREIQMAARPGYGMAASGAGGGLRQTFDTSDQVRPRQEFSSYTVKINLVCQGGYARSVVVWTALQCAWGSRFESCRLW